MIKESIAMGKSMISDEQLTNLSVRLFHGVSKWIDKTIVSLSPAMKNYESDNGEKLYNNLNKCVLQSHKILEIIRHVSLHDYRSIDIKHFSQEIAMFKELWYSFRKLIDEEYSEYDHFLYQSPTYGEIHNLLNDLLLEVKLHKKENIDYRAIAHFTTDNSIRDYLALFFESEIPFIKSFLQAISEKVADTIDIDSRNDFLQLYKAIKYLEEIRSMHGMLISPSTDNNQKNIVTSSLRMFISTCDSLISLADKTEENKFSIEIIINKSEHAKAVLRDMESF